MTILKHKSTTSVVGFSLLFSARKRRKSKHTLINRLTTSVAARALVLRKSVRACCIVRTTRGDNGFKTKTTTTTRAACQFIYALYSVQVGTSVYLCADKRGISFQCRLETASCVRIVFIIFSFCSVKRNGCFFFRQTIALHAIVIKIIIKPAASCDQ